MLGHTRAAEHFHTSTQGTETSGPPFRLGNGADLWAEGWPGLFLREMETSRTFAQREVAAPSECRKAESSIGSLQAFCSGDLTLCPPWGAGAWPPPQGFPHLFPCRGSGGRSWRAWGGPGWSLPDEGWPPAAPPAAKARTRLVKMQGVLCLEKFRCVFFFFLRVCFCM